MRGMASYQALTLALTAAKRETRGAPPAGRINRSIRQAIHRRHNVLLETPRVCEAFFVAISNLERTSALCCQKNGL